MKKLSKFAMLALALVFGLSILLGSPFMTTLASVPNTDEGKVFKASGIPSLVEEGNDLSIPVPTFAQHHGADVSGAVLTAELLNGSTGDKYVYTFAESTADVKLVYSDGTDKVLSAVPITNGAVVLDSADLADTTYYLTYKATVGDDVYYTERYQIVSEKDTFTLELEKSVVLPTTIKPSADAIVLPNAIIYDVEGNVVNDDVDVKVYYSTNTTPLTLSVVDGHKTFVANNEGTYRIYYSYKNAELANYPVTLVADNDFDSTAIKLTGSVSFPTAYLNEEVKLADPSVTDEDGNIVKVVTTKTVKYNNNGNLEDVTVADDAFVPTKAGKYIVTYTAVDYFGNAVKFNNGKTETLTYTYTEIKDTKAPNVYVVEDYDATTATKDSVVTAEWAVPTVWGSTNIYFPAIYGWDAVTGYNNLTFSRKLVYRADRTKSFDIDSRSKTVAGEDAKYNEGVVFNFKDTDTVRYGEYDVIYRVTDEAGKYTEKSFVINIKENVIDNTAPEIDLANLDNYINPNQTLSFKKPTATDNNDNSVRIKSYYFYGEQSDFVESEFTTAYANDRFLKDLSGLSVSLHEISAEDENKSGNYAVKLADFAGHDKVTIVVVAFDDGISNTNVGIGNVAFKYHTMDIVNISETDAPNIREGADHEFEILDDEHANEIGQNKTVIIPDVKFTDADSRLSLSINVYDKNGNAVTVSNAHYVYEANGAEYISSIKDAQFTTTVYGEYRVIYTARDASGNATTLIRTINVMNTTKPVITLVGSIKSSAELGEEITLPYAKVVTSEGETIKSDLAPDITGPNYTATGSVTFKPTAVGTYLVKYEYADATATSEYSIVVSDSTDPVITSKVTILEGDANADYIFPILKAEDASGIDWAKSSVKLTKDGSDEISFSRTADGKNYSFNPGNNTGKYTLTYTAVDNTGRKTVDTYTITIGDFIAPVINITDAKIPTSLKSNKGTFTIDLDTIVITDKTSNTGSANNLSKSDSDHNFSIVVTDASGNVQTATKITKADGANCDITDSEARFVSYKLTEAGKYTVTISITDDNGNTATKTAKITVTDKASSKTISDAEVGIILIILSLVLLAGVIVYFVLTGRKSKINKSK